MANLIKRGKTYYLQDRFSGKIKRTSLQTSSLQIAKEKLRQYESARLHGLDNPLPTRTPIGDIVGQYVDHIRTVKTAKSAQTDVYYLREAFGVVCPQIAITSRNPSAKTRKRPIKADADRRFKPYTIEAASFEAITTGDIQRFIDSHVRSRGLAPKTANRYREIICRLFNWAMKQKLVRMPGNINPASDVERHKERAGEISFLTLDQIDEQLHVLRFNPKLQTMIAVLIYAGLRREELLWLTLDDLDLPSVSGGQSGGGGGNGLIRTRAKTINGRHWQPKTKRNRAVPVSNALRTYLARYTPPATTAPPIDDHFRGWLFPSPNGHCWDPDGFSADLRNANKNAGLQWSCLDYRHTFGSQLAQRGVSLYKISSLMGNSPEICRRHYASLVPEAMHGEVDFTSRRQSLTNVGLDKYRP